MITTCKQIRLGGHCPRSGIAAVECAIVAPVLTLLVLGAVDLGQYANLYQMISDASREGARVAVKYDTKTTSEVLAAVQSYLQDASPRTSASTLASVTVTDEFGNPIANKLTNVATGSQLNVRVALQYDPVRWISGFKGLAGQQLTATTMMRRE